MSLQSKSVVRDMLWRVINDLISMAENMTADGIHVAVILKARHDDSIVEAIGLKTWVNQPGSGDTVSEVAAARWHASRIQFLDSCRLTIDEQLSRERQALQKVASRTEEPL